MKYIGILTISIKVINLDQFSKSYSYKLQRNSNGLCMDCGKTPPLIGRTLCSICRDAHKICSKKLRESRKAAGLCPLDGRPTDKGNVLCNDCRERLCKNNVLRKKENVAKNICSICGKNKLISGRLKCDVCYLKDAAKKYLGKRSSWKELLNLFERQKGICHYTGKKLILGFDTSIDHIVPKSKGGTNDINNLQWVY